MVVEAACLGCDRRLQITLPAGSPLTTQCPKCGRPATPEIIEDGSAGDQTGGWRDITNADPDDEMPLGQASDVEGPPALSSVELEMVALLTAGLTADEIATRYNRSRHSIEVRFYRMRRSARANSMPHLIGMCFRSGMLR